MATAMTAACNDASFGPVSTCRSFDFTLTFQNAVLLLGSGIFLIAALVQIAFLVPQPTLGSRRWTTIVRQKPLDKTGLVRVLLALLHTVFAAAQLGLVAGDENVRLEQALGGQMALAGYAIAFLASLSLIPSTAICRQKLPNSSPIISLYLVITVLTDACRLRTYGGVPSLRSSSFFAICIAQIITKGLALCAENTSGLQVEMVAPDAHSSFLSRMSFWWLMKTVLWTGYRRPLDMVNLSALGSGFDSEMLGRVLETKWQATMRKAIDQNEKKAKKDAQAVASETRINQDDGIELDDLAYQPKPKSTSSGDSAEQAASKSRTLLLKACFRAFPIAILAPVIPALVSVGIQLSLPFLVSRTLAFAESQTAAPSEQQPIEYGWGLVGAYALTGLVYAIAQGQFYWLADKAQVRLRGALIDIIYRKSLRLHLSTANDIGGSISNLMAVDLERFCRAIVPVHTLWSGLLQVIVSAYFLYRQLRWAFIATILTTIFCIAVPPIIGRGIGTAQSNWSKSTDKRVSLVSSGVTNAKAVKYMAYERFIANRLIQVREEELRYGWIYLKRLIAIGCFTNLVLEMTALSTFTTLLLVDYYTGSDRFNITNVVTSMTFLTLMETPLLMIGQQYGSIVAALVSLRRIQEFLGKRERPVTENIYDPRTSYDSTPSAGDSDAASGAKPSAKASDTAAAGAAAATDESSVAVSFESASLGWSPNGKAVLINVSLEIPTSVLTIICGPIGCGKTTLLQAILGEVDVLGGSIRLPILRDSVAYVAQDGWLQENATIRENITLQSRFDAELYQTVIYATALHIDLNQLDNHDDTPAKSLSGGQRQRLALARALYSQAEAYVMDDFTSALDAETAAHVWTSLMGPAGLLRNKTVIFATNALQFLSRAALVIRLQDGKVIEAARPQDLTIAAREAISRASVDETERAEALQKTFKVIENTESRKDARHEEVESGEIKWSVYRDWLQAAGIVAIVISYIVGFGLIAGLKAGWQVYLQYFARAQDTPQGEQAQFKWLAGFISLLCSIMVLFPIADLRSCWLSFTRVGRKLHKAQVQGVWNASISFFESHPPGVIINRFSQDIFIMDWDLPMASLNFVGCLFELLSQMILLIIPVPYLTIVIVIVTGAYFVIQRFYAPVSRQLRRLEMATKSPLYSQFTETSQPSGLATIRALRRQQVFIDVNLGRLDRSQQPYFYLQAVRRWLLCWLNLLTVVVSVALVTIIVLLRHTKSIGLLGAGLITATQLSRSLNHTLIAYTELEITTVALERIVGFARLPAEEEPTTTDKKRRIDLKPDEVKGKLELRDLHVTYPGAPSPALKGIDLTIRPGERIGICGRSGSGKSTLLLAIFRMLEPSEGEILLDDKPLDTISAFNLRNCLTIVPQNPLVLTASVRENLDPLHEHKDPAIWDALETCKLLDVVRGFPNGLDTELDATFNLSAGQRQLFNLTRALLRDRRVLVLDEATSSMDYETDEAMQEVLRKQFKHCTIFTVAHRIATVRDYDRILVLSNGQVVELDTPDALMKRPDGIFRSLANEQGIV